MGTTLSAFHSLNVFQSTVVSSSLHVTGSNQLLRYPVRPLHMVRVGVEARFGDTLKIRNQFGAQIA